MDEHHYLPVFLGKPRAFHEALQNLTVKDQVGEDRLSRVLELAPIRSGQYRFVAADAVRHLLHRMERPWQPPFPLDLEPLGLTAPKVSIADPSRYNRLLRIA